MSIEPSTPRQTTPTGSDCTDGAGLGAAVPPGDERRAAPGTRRPRVALVLGSGGARGYAHIGVVRELEAAGVDIVAVSGSSMGALVGALHAIGRLEQYTEWAVGLTRLDIVRMMDVTWTRPGTIRGERIFRIVGELLGDVLIEDLPIPYTAVAVDLLSGREVWFQEGSAELAVRASSAIPSFFVPVVLQDRVLVDGGLLNPVPVAPVAAAQADRIVAVSLGGRATSRGGAVPVAPGPAGSVPRDRLRSAAGKWLDSGRLGPVRRYVSDERLAAARALLAAGPSREEDPQPGTGDVADPDLRTRDVMLSALEVMQDALGRHRLADYPPDVLITVRRDACRTLDFHRAADLIELGRRLAHDALPAIGFETSPEPAPAVDRTTGPAAEAW